MQTCMSTLVDFSSIESVHTSNGRFIKPLNACKRTPTLPIEWPYGKMGIRNGDAILSINRLVLRENVFAWILMITEDTYATI